MRGLEEGLGSTPAMLLSGAGRLEDSFGSLRVDRDDDWTWCRLTPVAKTSDFETVSLALDRRRELAGDGTYRQARPDHALEFSGLSRNTPIDEKLFRFAPPAGVDVIGDDGA